MGSHPMITHVPVPALDPALVDELDGDALKAGWEPSAGVPVS